MKSGELHAWGNLANMEPSHVCIKADATFDKENNCYILKSFGYDLFVSLKDKAISGSGSKTDVILNRLKYFSTLSVLHYLTDSRDIPISGKMVKPVDMKMGQIYFKGSHVLPLNSIAQKYGKDLSGFLKKGKIYGGTQLSYGDASLRFLPFPKIPIIIILWKEDDEFPSRADILFDSTCESHLPADIIWSIAMMTVLLML